ncbi:MAG: tRNA(Ser) Um(44) 2'-O-methyltransferase [Vezdaea aestivalis]|nr:MAG: tRNA(Ser) Um(44) 2'-O-methyltransferase [Vezdaea aestivalis]
MPYEPNHLHASLVKPPFASNATEDKWRSILSQHCDFDRHVFEKVMMNLIWNPNINSTFVFRADCVYDDGHAEQNGQVREGDERPRPVIIEGYQATRTIVRRMIPRNPQRDKTLFQTCVVLEPKGDSDSRVLVVYIPHADSVDEIPFYHPKISGLAYLYAHGNLCISFKFFEALSEQDLSDRLIRTATSLLGTVYKHGQGSINGYQKRVQHDTIVPQIRLQNTYTRLKTKYAKPLIESWVEVTDPAKHVFEDLCIAAFLIELWADVYSKEPFPGFVDIGAGNGLLVHILISEGFSGRGFDARRRKSWGTYPNITQNNLKELILVPKVLAQSALEDLKPEQIHDGVFPAGTFIISNHADELTVWTPLLAFISQSPFLCIPCCSHSLSGERFRAPSTTVGSKVTKGSKAANSKLPSAYASLCDYTQSLGEELGFRMEREMLRIPSTRNVGLLNRDPYLNIGLDQQERTKQIKALIEREGGGVGFIQRCSALRDKSRNH